MKKQFDIKKLFNKILCATSGHKYVIVKAVGEIKPVKLRCGRFGCDYYPGKDIPVVYQASPPGEPIRYEPCTHEHPCNRDNKQ